MGVFLCFDHDTPASSTQHRIHASMAYGRHAVHIRVHQTDRIELNIPRLLTGTHQEGALLSHIREKEAYKLQPEMKQAAKVSYSNGKYFAPT